ncbi:MAG TPA: hypothetical protein VEC38_03950 [Candidatus Binataceae bacterium]|nr:hypothetical protein [Candidatus Binataceae bacterium]
MSPHGVSAAIVAAALLGFRHGVDYDHVAAIADLTGAARSPRRAIAVALLYGLGHAAIITVLGGFAVALGVVMPVGADRLMESAVGLTLVVLGAYVLSALWTGAPGSRPATRYELISRASRWLVARLQSRDVPVADAPSGAPPGGGTAFTVGIIHGIGAETPTQLSLFVLSAGVGGWGAGLFCVVTFAAGLLAMNALMAFASAGTFRLSSLREPVYRFVMLATGAYSVVIGAVFILGGIGVSIP